MNYKLNGRLVTKEEWDRRMAEREALYGNQLADMLSSQQAPRVMTDDVYLAGVGSLEQQIPEKDHLELVTKTAMAHGYKPKASDYYRPDLAEFPGDPKAFLNHGQGLGHLKKTLAERGMHMDRDGDVHCQEPHRDPYEKPKLKLHPKLVRKIKKDRVKDNPDLARADQRELVEDIVATHGWNEER